MYGLRTLDPHGRGYWVLTYLGTAGARFHDQRFCPGSLRRSSQNTKVLLISRPLISHASSPETPFTIYVQAFDVLKDPVYDVYGRLLHVNWYIASNSCGGVTMEVRLGPYRISQDEATSRHRLPKSGSSAVHWPCSLGEPPAGAGAGAAAAAAGGTLAKLTKHFSRRHSKQVMHTFRVGRLTPATAQVVIFFTSPRGMRSLKQKSENDLLSWMSPVSSPLIFTE